MSGGADGSGDDMVVGRRNESGDSTSLIAINDDGEVYGDDHVLRVATYLLAIKSIDAIHAEGEHGGNGVVSKGLNGVVGYVAANARDKSLENSVGAGLLGSGGGASPGVFGSGLNGVVGYEQTTPRDVPFEGAQHAGVVGLGAIGVSGLGDTGVRGDSASGTGVYGSGSPGVHGASQLGPGVLGEGDTGVIASGESIGLLASSKTENAAVLESRRVAQLRLIPLRMKDPTSLPKSEPGELLVTIWPSSDQRDAIDVASLWFCTDARAGTSPNWVKLA